MVKYIDYNISGQERIKVSDFAMEIDRDEHKLPLISQHPLFPKVTKKLNFLKLQRDKIELSISENSSPYKISQLEKINEDINLLVEMLEFINEAYSKNYEQRDSYRKGIWAFLKGSDLIEIIANMQVVITDSHDQIIDSLEFSIKLLEANKGIADPEKLKIFKDKLSVNLKKYYDSITTKTNELLNGAN